MVQSPNTALIKMAISPKQSFIGPRAFHSGDEDVRWFSFDERHHVERPQLTCHLTRTTGRGSHSFTFQLNLSRV